ncbi:MAG: hypothetical protein ACREMS_07020 [Gemmatimonadaceae bacterium]
MEGALTHDATKLLRVETNGVLYMAVGAIETPDGIGWLDQAVLFCPFCGAQLQTKEEIQQARDL